MRYDGPVAYQCITNSIFLVLRDPLLTLPEPSSFGLELCGERLGSVLDGVRAGSFFTRNKLFFSISAFVMILKKLFVFHPIGGVFWKDLGECLADSFHCTKVTSCVRVFFALQLRPFSISLCKFFPYLFLCNYVKEIIRVSSHWRGVLEGFGEYWPILSLPFNIPPE
jgi:hypothetical protein